MNRTTTKVTWESKSEKDEVEFYRLAKGLSMTSFLRFATLQYMGRFKLKPKEIERATKILDERKKVH